MVDIDKNYVYSRLNDETPADEDNREAGRWQKSCYQLKNQCVITTFCELNYSEYVFVRFNYDDIYKNVF